MTRVAIVVGFLLCATAPVAQADCLLEARAMIGNMVKLPPFRLAIKTATQGVESRMTGEVIMPDSFRLDFGNSSMIVTPRGAWAKVKGKWAPQPAEVAAGMKRTLLSGMTDNLTKMRLPVCNTNAKLGGKAYKSIEFDVYEQPKDKLPIAHTTFYLNKKNLPVWMVTQTRSTKGNALVVQQFAYDAKIRIDDPK